MLNTTIKAGAFIAGALASTGALAHGALVPHDHPHGDTWVLGLETAALATLAGAAAVGLVIALRARRARVQSRDRARGRGQQ